MRAWREGSLNLALWIWAWLVLTTEGLSLIHQLNRGGIAAAWGLFLLGLIGYGWQNRWFRHRFSLRFRGWALEDQVLLGGVALIALMLAVIAVVAPPNTWDSMSYHLPRIMHWLQQGSLAHMFLVIFSSLWLFWSETKPVLSSKNIFNTPREQQYFMVLSYGDAYRETIDYLAGQRCDRLGLKLGENDWEYPLWAFSQRTFPKLPQFHHVLVENSSQSARNQAEFRPCLILHIGQHQPTLLTPWGTFTHHWQPPSDQGILPNSHINLYHP